MVLYILAAIGAVAVVWFIVGTVGRSRRAMAVTNGFHLASREAVLAIQAEPPDEQRQFRALTEWQRQRAQLASLAPGEQRVAAELLAERGVSVAEVVRVIEAFIQQQDEAHRHQDAELATMLQGAQRGR